MQLLVSLAAACRCFQPGPKHLRLPCMCPYVDGPRRSHLLCTPGIQEWHPWRPFPSTPVHPCARTLEPTPMAPTHMAATMPRLPQPPPGAARQKVEEE